MWIDTRLYELARENLWLHQALKEATQQIERLNAEIAKLHRSKVDHGGEE